MTKAQMLIFLVQQELHVSLTLAQQLQIPRYKGMDTIKQNKWDVTAYTESNH